MAKPSISKTAVDRRADELDTIASVLPIDRRDELAELLTDQDIETLRHLVNEGMGENTLRALTSDLAYLQAWSLAATGASLPWPAPEALALKFVAHHLWQPEQRDIDPHHGMPADVEQSLREQRFPSILRAACARYGAPAACQLVDADEMARADRRLLLPFAEIRDTPCRSGDAAAKETQERQGGDRRRPCQAARDLQHRQPARYP